MMTSPQITKNIEISITSAVTTLFNMSLMLGKLLDEWKVSRVVPIPKRVIVQTLIPLLSILNQLLEDHISALLVDRF